jgi:glutathione peroxidase-family protein
MGGTDYTSEWAFLPLKEIRLSHFKGQVVVIVFCATWCALHTDDPA